MLLVQSPVAKLVRHYLLSAEEQSNAILYRQHGLMDMATQLQEQAQKLAKHSTQLVSQADLIKASILEIYKNRDEISHNRSRIEELEVKFSVLDGSRNVDEQAYITPEQIEVLREKVKQKGRPVTIWRKFNRHFQITRYKFLPRNPASECQPPDDVNKHFGRRVYSVVKSTPKAEHGVFQGTVS